MRRFVIAAGAFAPAVLLAAAVLSSASGPAVRAQGHGLLDSVSVGRIEAAALRLSVLPDGTPRSRYTARAEIEDAASYIDSSLRASLAPGDTVFFHRWRWVRRLSAAESETLYPANVIGIHRGRHPGTGAYVLGAHYDATGAQSEGGWDDEIDPAPGFDDNASGTATVLEAARVLGRVPMDVDIAFVFFSGEEQGLLGSEALAESLFDAHVPLHGLFNFDMICYRRGGERLEIVAMLNRLSQWMTALLARKQEEIGEEVSGIRFRETAPLGERSSDQASFWRKGYDGILLIESENARAYNPNYHKATDRPDGYAAGEIQFEQAAGILRLVVATLDGFRDAPPGLTEFAVHPDQIFVAVDGRRQETAVADPGQEVLISAGGLWLGGTSESGETRFLFRRGDELLPGGERAKVGYRPTGAVLRDSLVWVPGPDDVGLHRISVTIQDAFTADAEPGDNAAVDTILVRGAGMSVVAAVVHPNPLRGAASGGVSPSSASLRVAVGREGSVVAEVFDVAGRRVGRPSEPIPVEGTHVEIPISAMLGDVEVGSGVYFFRVSARGAHGNGAKSGRFVVLR
jgi:hypothetical protein